MAAIVWKPDRKTLAGFSEAWMFVFGMIAAPLSLWKGHPTFAAGLWGLAVVVRLVGLSHPSLLRPIYVGLNVLTFPIGWLVSNLLLAIVYYGTVWPIGALRRARVADPLAEQLDPGAATYWEAVSPQANRERFFRQY